MLKIKSSVKTALFGTLIAVVLGFGVRYTNIGPQNRVMVRDYDHDRRVVEVLDNGQRYKVYGSQYGYMAVVYRKNGETGFTVVGPDGSSPTEEQMKTIRTEMNKRCGIEPGFTTYVQDPTDGTTDIGCPLKSDYGN